MCSHVAAVLLKVKAAWLQQAYMRFASVYMESVFYTKVMFDK